MGVRFTIFTLVLFYSLLSQAEIGYYRLPITRDGVTETKLAYNFWAGEYPGPVMDVTKSITVNGYSSIRELNDNAPCTIEKGLYHPWSEEENSVLLYYTITKLTTYTAKTDTTFDYIYELDDETFDQKTQKIKKEEYITDVHGGSEGWCYGRFVNNQNQSVDLDFDCASLDMDPVGFEITNPWNPEQDEQWMQMQCKEGHKAFVSDTELMNHPSVKEGEYLDYGIVGRL